MAQPAAGQKRKRDGDRQSGQQRPKSSNNYKGKQRATQENSEQGITSGKLHHSLQLITRAAKKARTFEIQKLVRKIKSDKAKAELPAGTSKLHAELEEILTTLKSLDADELASQALSSKLQKDKTGLQNNAEVQTFITSHPTKTSDGTSVSAKAQKRILANKVVVQSLQEVLDALRQKAGIGSATSTKSKDSVKPSKEDKKTALTAQNLAKATIDPARKERIAKSPKDDDETSSEEDSDEEGSGATASHISAEESIPDDEFVGLQQGSEDASDEESDDDSEGGSVSGASTSSFPTVAKKDPKSSKEASKSKRQKVTATSPPTTSAFLPSLAAGYTLGDSDGSVYSDDDAADTKPARKNRRGQRARQAIWERKYGKNAKHVIKSQQRNAETEEARQRAKAEKEIEHLKKTGRYVYGVESNLTKPSEGKQSRTWTAATPSDKATEKMSALLAAEAEAKAKKAPANNALHPSWEARKKAKEAQANLAAAKPAGKKIVFD
ncbi:Bud-site selection protein [Cystobasidium minutum MCA 4210]|uniref:Bud-site selection protein n=1 Tax=Cystobasidium minutum MCA 4210 TaxID=1397322 RepID=UPI0034CFC12C|eukprot:jgi/Rhomi1/209939/estExt_Genemark1.C_3_t20119